MTRRRALVALAVAALALHCERPAAQARPEPAAAPERAALDAILDRYHGPLRGAFDTAILVLREQPEGEGTQVLLALPDRMRVGYPDGSVDLLVGSAGWRCRRGTTAERLEGETLGALARLRDQLCAVMLIPLYRAEKVTRAEKGSYTLALPGGETWRVRLDEAATEVLELEGPGGLVRFRSFLDTGVTRHPAVVEMAGVGRRHVEFLTAGAYLDPALFEDPFLPPRPKNAPRPGVTRALGDPAELPPEAELQDVPGRRYLVLGAPGSWQERCQRMATAAQELTEQGQIAHGLPTYRLAPEGTTLLIPFRPDPAAGSQPFLRQEGQTTLHIPAHRAVVVAPPRGTWDDALERGRELLREFLARHRLEPDGPPRCVPFVAPDRVPDDAQLSRLQLRLEQPIAER